MQIEINTWKLRKQLPPLDDTFAAKSVNTCKLLQIVRKTPEMCCDFLQHMCH